MGIYKNTQKQYENKSLISNAFIRTNEAIEQIKKKQKIQELYLITDTPSLLNFTIKTMFYMPSILWKLRKINKVKSERFWYVNRNNEAIQGIIYGLPTQEKLPIIAFDSGYKRDLFNFSIVGKVLACLGYRAFSVRSRNELKSIEADDYMDALDYLKDKHPNKNLYTNKSAVIGLSGGNIVVYKSCSSKEFVNKHNIKCGISISPFDDLAEQFKYLKKKINDNEISENTKRILLDYNKYIESLGVTDTSDEELFRNGSPITYCKDMDVPMLIEHGIADDVVPSVGSIRIYRELKRHQKEAELILILGKGIHGDLKKWGENIVETIGLLSSIIFAYKFLEKHMK
jgi:hypothetical protein